MLLYTPDDNYAKHHTTLRNALHTLRRQDGGLTLFNYTVRLPYVTFAQTDAMRHEIIDAFDDVTQRLRSGYHHNGHLPPIHTTHYGRLVMSECGVWGLNVTMVVNGSHIADHGDVTDIIMDAIRIQLATYNFTLNDTPFEISSDSSRGDRGWLLNRIYRHIGLDATQVPEWQSTYACITRNPLPISDTHKKDITFILDAATAIHGNITAVYMTFEDPDVDGYDTPPVIDFPHTELPRIVRNVSIFSREGMLRNGHRGLHVIMVVPHHTAAELGAGYGHGDGLLDRIKRHFALWVSDLGHTGVYNYITYPEDAIIQMTRLPDGTADIPDIWWTICQDTIVEDTHTLYTHHTLVEGQYGCPLAEGLTNDGLTVVTSLHRPPELVYLDEQEDMVTPFRWDSGMTAMVLDVCVDDARESMPDILRLVNSIRTDYPGSVVNIYHKPDTSTIRLLLLIPVSNTEAHGHHTGYGPGISDKIIRHWGCIKDPHYPARYYSAVKFITLHDNLLDTDCHSDTHPYGLLTLYRRIAESTYLTHLRGSMVTA